MPQISFTTFFSSSINSLKGILIIYSLGLLSFLNLLVWVCFLMILTILE